MFSLFELLFLFTLNRLFEKDTGEQIQIKAASQDINSLSRQKSVIREKPSETLLSEVFGIIFSEI